MMYVYAGNDHIAAVTDKIDADKHSHLMLQISISIRHEFSISIGEKQFYCKGIILSSNTDHTFYSNQDAQIFFLIDSSSIIAKQLNQKYLRGQSYYVIDDESINLIQYILQRCYPILDKEHYLKFYTQLFQILQISTDAYTVMDERIISLLSRIKNCTNTEHSIEEMAKSLFLSKSRLSHLFKKETGMRLCSYLVLHKLQKAMLYVFSNKNKTEAAVMAGFDSPSHFAAVCKKTLGMSARELDEDSVFLKVNTY
ncbi:helix-turn-helix transcriptional regulator [Clostridium sp. CF012]|uniref:helix-turn-helix transcriptional regulator n=1 Tax=Clostridium sp. CF012 TaxID=2843319 RepID=UPI001C0CE30A|nr:helix-turn-helix transcriptional regulator [Clostridium sp. CF012]MBU3144232.1 helix-turn-helix transcriptional regulator [Clostridium sp. CF012]